MNRTSSKKQIEINDNEILEEFFNEKKISIINEECLLDTGTPAFCEIEKKQSNTAQKILTSSNNNDSNNNVLDISLRDIIFVSGSESKTEDNSPKLKAPKKKNIEKVNHIKRKKHFLQIIILLIQIIIEEVLNFLKI